MQKRRPENRRILQNFHMSARKKGKTKPQSAQPQSAEGVEPNDEPSMLRDAILNNKSSKVAAIFKRTTDVAKLVNALVDGSDSLSKVITGNGSDEIPLLFF